MKITTEFDLNKIVLYEVYVRSFYDSNSDGIGDLVGIIDKLDYLAGGPKSLGVSAIWLTPFYPSPMVDFGYDVENYLDVDPIYGTLEDFKKLIEEAHKRKIRVLIDFIPNHTSDKHPWFQSSKLSSNNKYRDWYVWRNPKTDGSPPNNWRNIVGDSAWTFDKSTNQYYLHSFLRQQPDLNWENPNVREALKKVLRFWSKLGVDGFRVDSVEWISKDPNLKDDPIDPDYSIISKPNPYNALLHKNSKRGPKLYSYLREIDEIIKDYPNQIILLESHPHKWNDVEAYLKYYEQSSTNAVAPLNFEALNTPWVASSYRKFIDDFQTSLKPNYLPIYTFGSHDVSRLASRVGIHAAPTAAMLLLTLPGLPIMYYGDELGMVDQTIETHTTKDGFEKKRPGIGIGRDPERTPLLWDNSHNAGFSSSNPWLPVSTNYPIENIKSQLINKVSILNLYRNLINLRNKSDVLQRGAYRSYTINSSVFCYKRSLNGTNYLIVLNFSEQTLKLNNENLRGEIILSTYLDTTNKSISSKIVLRSNEGLIIKNNF